MFPCRSATSCSIQPCQCRLGVLGLCLGLKGAPGRSCEQSRQQVAGGMSDMEPQSLTSSILAKAGWHSELKLVALLQEQGTLQHDRCHISFVSCYNPTEPHTTPIDLLRPHNLPGTRFETKSSRATAKTGSGTTHSMLTACSDARAQGCTLSGEVLCHGPRARGGEHEPYWRSWSLRWKATHGRTHPACRGMRSWKGFARGMLYGLWALPSSWSP